MQEILNIFTFHGESLFLHSLSSAVPIPGRLPVTKAHQNAQGLAMPLLWLLALSYLDTWHLLQFLGSQSWKLFRALRVAAARKCLHPRSGMAVGTPGQCSRSCSHTALGASRAMGQISSL